MSNNSDSNVNDTNHLQNQLNLARREINNLRHQLKTLNHIHRAECEEIKEKLDTWRCLECKNRQTNLETASAIPVEKVSNIETSLSFKYIGVISTKFPEKRGTPRQPGICPEMTAKLTLNNEVFTNPNHALEGLQEYSHLWILFHFHKNDSTHIRAKVTPPRLNGIRTGVFATRSPHRPSPIGLSLVKIDRIMESCIYFSGVDMVDQTPVIDIKPYIPQYDNPNNANYLRINNTVERNSRDFVANDPIPTSSSSRADSRRVMDGEETERSDHILGAASTDRRVPETANTQSNLDLELRYIRSGSRMGEREAPDGEEEESSNPTTSIPNQSLPVDEQSVRVPSWIDQPPVQQLNVVFKDRALTQLQQLGAEGEEKKVVITNVLREDPRSVYLRARWSSHCYVFRIAELFVSCKFDDSSHSVTVFKVFQNSTSPECDD